MRSRDWLLTASFLLLVGCQCGPEATIGQCASVQCGPGLVCDSNTGRCVVASEGDAGPTDAGGLDSGSPADCVPACSGATPWCDPLSLTCRVCTSAGGCSGLTTACDVSANGGLGQCVQCVVNEDCPVPGTICALATHTCVAPMTGGGGGAMGGGGGSTGGGAGGGGAGGGGGSTGGGTGGGAMTPVDFDGGWVLPPAGHHPALVGDGGVTVEIGPGATVNAPNLFGGSVTGAAIQVVYPATGVLLPPNTNSLEFHFVPGSGQTLFRFTFVAPTTTLQVYTGCTPLGAGCVFTPAPTFWTSLVDYARGTAPVQWRVEGVNGTNPGAVGASAWQDLGFTEQDLTGGLYYWNSAGTVVRYDYGYPNAPATTYLRASNVGAFACVGCHVLSRQGNLVLAGKDIPSPAAFSLLSVATRTPYASTAGAVTGSGNFFSFAPDEQHLLTSNGVSIGWLDLRNSASHAVTSNGTMPDWSPSGTEVVFSRPASPPPLGFASTGVTSASLQTMHFNGLGFDPPQVLVPFTGANNYYPTYSPDGEWVLFNRSPGNHNSYANASVNDAGVAPDGEMWIIPATGGAPLALPRVNASTSTWPKWAPVKQDSADGPVMWLTFSSQRAYGLRLADGQQTQLWMVAFNPARARVGLDPTSTPFWLPFQDLASGNHIGQWSTKVPRPPCSGSGQSTCEAGEVCTSGVCRPG